MSFEKELTIAVMDQNENPLGYLDSNCVQLTETNELYNLRLLDITHPLMDEHAVEGENAYSRYDTLLVHGNKLWMPQSPTGDSCLYILNADKPYDFDKNLISITATEAAVELSQNKVIRLNTTLTTSTTNLTTFLQTHYCELFQVGTINGPSSTVTLNGAFTPLEILRKIETTTGGEFKFRYEYENGQINRYIDFYDQIGDTHTTPIELGYNATGIDLTLNEENTRIAAAPTGEPSNDASSFHAALAAFEAMAFSTSTQIPLYVTKDDAGTTVTGPLAYPPYPKPAGQNWVESNVSGELVASYQRCKPCKTLLNKYYSDTFEDGTYSDWTLEGGTPAIESSSPISGNYSIKHTGNGSDSLNNLLHRATSQLNKVTKFDFKLATQGVATNTPLVFLWFLRWTSTGKMMLWTAYNSSTGKQTLNISKYESSTWTDIKSVDWLTGKLAVGTKYSFEITDTGSNIIVKINGTTILSTAYTTGQGVGDIGYGANKDSSGIWDNIETFPYGLPTTLSQPRIYTFDTTETNVYNLYWLCVENIRSYLQPEVTIKSTVVDIKKLKGATPEQYKTGDTVHVRLPNKTTVVQARITKTVKDPREPESDDITISSYQTSHLGDLYKGYYKSAGTIDV